ncbi:MAG: beta strand repeat-containing protein, partial [Aggregatilineales bacterium]
RWHWLPIAVLFVLFPALLPHAQSDPLPYLYYFESSDAVLMDGIDSARFTFATLPGESVTLVAYGLDELIQPELRLFDATGALVNQGVRDESQPYVTYIQFESTTNDIFEFEVRRSFLAADDNGGIARVMLFEGDPLSDDLTLLDDINPLLPGRAFMVAGEAGDGLRTLVEVLDVERFTEKPQVFASRSTLSLLPDIAERFDGVDVRLWFNDDGDAIYTFNIRAVPEIRTVATRDANFEYRRFNLNTFFYFDYYFTVGAGSDPVRVIRDEECAFLVDRAECVTGSPTGGRTPDTPDVLPPTGVPLPIILESVTEPGVILPPPPDEVDCVTAGVGLNINMTMPGAQGGSLCSDTIIGTAGDDNIAGFGDNDIIDGGAGNDVLRGGAGNDVIIPGEGNDLVDGEAGLDTVSYTPSAIAVTVDLNNSASPMGGVATYGGYTDVLLNIENILGSGFDDVLSGSAGANSIYGRGGADTINGRGGDDILDGQVGNDTINGGTGNDTIYGGDDNDIINGEMGDDILFGDEGNDTINGGAGNDAIQGGNGDDILRPGGGNDDVRGNGGNDIIHLNGTFIGSYISGGTFSVDPLSGDDRFVFYDDSQGNINIWDAVGNDVLDFTAITRTPGTPGIIMGTASQTYTSVIPGLNVYLAFDMPILIGTDGDDILNGSGSDERIEGRAGNDVIFGSAGDDTLLGGADNDTLDYTRLAGGDSVYVDLAGNVGEVYTVTGALIGTDTVTGFETVIGTANDDDLRGDATGNILNPGTGGMDIVNGRGGIDTVDFSTRNTAIDVSLETGNGTDSTDTITILNTENIIGTAYDDTIEGDTGNNSIESNDGDDAFTATSGTDTLDGGMGRDTVTYTTGNGGVAPGNLTATINYLTGSTVDTANWTGTDTLINVENIIVDGALNSDDIFNVQRGGTGTTNNVRLSGGDGSDVYAFLAGSAGYIDLDNKSIDNINFASTPISWNPLNTGVWQNVFGNSTLFVRISAAINPNCRAPGVANPIFGAPNAPDNGAGTFDRALTLCDSDEMFYGNGGGRTPDTGTFIDEVDYGLLTPGVGEFLTYTVGNTISITGTGVDIGTDTLIDIERIIGTTGQDIFAFTDAAATYDTQGSVLTLNGRNAGNDVLDFSAVTVGGVNINLALLNVDQVIFPGMDLRLISNFTEVIGSNNDDTILGNTGNNILWDKDGTDTVSAGAGNDTIIMAGDSDNDIIDGGTGIDTADYSVEGAATIFTIQAGADTALNNVTGTGLDTLTSIERILGSGGGDIFDITDATGYTLLSGGGADDTYNVTLQAGLAGLTLQGDAGVDTVDFSTSVAPVTVTLNEAAGTVVGGGSVYTLNTIENVTGGQSTDTFNITSDSVANRFDGQGGTDTLRYNTTTTPLTFNFNGSGGLSQVLSTNPADSFTNFETLMSGSGDDIFNVNDDTGLVSINSNIGDDTINVDTLNNDVTINGSTGTDTVNYDAVATDLTLNLAATRTITNGIQTHTLLSIEEYVTGTGDDIINLVGNANTTIDGHTGNDTFNVTWSGNHILNAGAAADTDTIDYTSAAALTLTYTGTGTDTVSVGATTDTLINFDSFNLGAGADTFALTVDGVANVFNGDTGVDTATYAGTATGINFNIASGVSGTNFAGLDALINIENVIGGDAADTFTVTNATGFNSLGGGAGDDTFNINQDTAALTYDGDTGNDTLAYTTNLNQIVTLNAGNGTVQRGAITDTVADIENITTGAGNDTFETTWDIISNTFDGGAGTDNLLYAANSATISTLNFVVTGTGSGTIGDGTTTDSFQNMEVVTASDTFTGDDSFFVLDATGTTTLDGGATGSDTVLFGEAVTVTLTNGNGAAGGITLTDIENVSTGAGNDTIIQNADLDTENNTFNGGTGSDTVTYDSTAPTNINVTMNGTDGTAQHGANTDTLLNVENVNTGDGADTFVVTDDAGIETLDGNAGDDTFVVN